MDAVLATIELARQLARLDEERLNRMPPEKREAELRQRKLKRLSEKDERMQRRLARHRAAIWKRNWSFFGGWFLFLSAMPLAIFIVSELWQLAARSIFE